MTTTSTRLLHIGLTAQDTDPGDVGLTAQERQAAAQDAYRASVDVGEPLTGAELGRRFDRTDRWGRLQIEKVRNKSSTGTSSTGDSTDSNSKPASVTR